MRKLTIFYYGIAIFSLVYAFFLPWPASFGQSGYGNNFGYGITPHFDLSGIWLEETTGREFMILHEQQEDLFIAAEMWLDTNTPGVALSTLHMAVLNGKNSYNSSEELGALYTPEETNYGLRFQSTIYYIDEDTLEFRLDSCEDTATGVTVNNLCDNITIGERRILERTAPI